MKLLNASRPRPCKRRMKSIFVLAFAVMTDAAANGFLQKESKLAQDNVSGIKGMLGIVSEQLKQAQEEWGLAEV